MASTYTNPGIRRGFQHHLLSDEENKIVAKLQASGYLTSAGSIFVGRSQYRTAFMRPSEVFAKSFNIKREIIIVFSDYPAYESRSLEVFTKVNETLDDLRTESICGIVISKAADVSERVAETIKDRPEKRVIIPFTYDELLKDGSPNSVLQKFRDNFYSRDLFDLTAPLTRDFDFFGRYNSVQEIAGSLREGENQGIFGLRRSGKTSVLNAVQRSLAATDEQIVLRLDLQTPALNSLRWWELLEQIRDDYVNLIDSPIKSLNRTPFSEADGSGRFAHDILEIRATKKRRRLILVLDEIERITPDTASQRHWEQDLDFIKFWQTLRAFHQENPEYIAYCVAGTNPACIETRKYHGEDNPLYLSAGRRFIAGFEPSQTEEMMNRLGSYMGLHFLDTAVSFAHDLCGGHPFLIRQFSSQIHKQLKMDRPADVGRGNCLRSAEDFRSASSPQIADLVDVLRQDYEDEYTMLVYLANEDRESFKAFKTEYPKLLDHVLSYGILEKAGGEYAFKIQALEDMLKHEHRFERKGLNEEERSNQIGGLRRALERRLRGAILAVMSVHFADEDLDDEVRRSLAKRDRESYSSLTVDEILAPNHSPLYLLQLFQILQRHYPLFKNLIAKPKAQATSDFEVMNEARRIETHSRESVEEDFYAARAVFVYYLDRFRRFSKTPI